MLRLIAAGFLLITAACTTENEIISQNLYDYSPIHNINQAPRKLDNSFIIPTMSATSSKSSTRSSVRTQSPQPTRLTTLSATSTKTMTSTQTTTRSSTMS